MRKSVQNSISMIIVNKKFCPISREEFENYLKQYYFREFSNEEYKVNWVLSRDGNEWKLSDIPIFEICYIIPLSDKYCIKVYSTIDKSTLMARKKGDDSIKLVTARLSDLKPVKGKYSHIQRIFSWRDNFEQRINKILEDLGNNLECDCGGRYRMLKNRSNINFLGCTKYSENKCKGKTIIVQ